MPTVYVMYMYLYGASIYRLGVVSSCSYRSEKNRMDDLRATVPFVFKRIAIQDVQKLALEFFLHAKMHSDWSRSAREFIIYVLHFPWSVNVYKGKKIGDK